MKLWKWVIIIIASFLLPLILTLVITRLILDPSASWWWFLGLLFGEVFIGAIIGAVVLIVKLWKRKEPEMKIAHEDARALAVYNIVTDKFNPENFVPSSKGTISQEGDPSKPRTTIYHIPGTGKVFNVPIDVLINMNESTKRKLVMSDLRNASPEEIESKKKSMAEFPIEETTERTTVSADMYGRPQTTTEKKYISKMEKEKKEEEEQADIAGAY